MYQKIVDEMHAFISKNVSSHESLYPFLIHDLEQIQNHINRLKPSNKIKRSLNFIGSAWKWVAGSPDHDDLKILSHKINNVLQNNNRQIIINRATTDKLKELTNVTNAIIKLIKSNENLRNERMLVIRSKINILKEEIINIDYAVQWAKANIINSFILSNSETNIVKDILRKDNMPYLSIEEILEFSDVRIATNRTNIIYIINVPLTDNEKCINLLAKPIKKGIYVNEINYESILNCKTKIFGIKDKCKVYNDLTICMEKNLIDISNSSCIPYLLKSQPSSCKKINNQHIPTVEEIGSGTLLLNQYNGTINIDDNEVNLTGTFIIQYHNTSITADGKIYTSEEVSKIKPLPALLQPWSNKSEFEEVLSLKMIKDLHINNTKFIQLLELENNVKHIGSYTLSIIAIIIFITLVVKLYRKKEHHEPKITIVKTTNTVTEDAPEISTESQKPATPKISPKICTIRQIPLF